MSTTRRSSRVIKPLKIWDPSEEIIETKIETNNEISKEINIEIIKETDEQIIITESCVITTQCIDETHETSTNQVIESTNNDPLKNPWDIEQLDDFLFYCCPECDHRTKNFEPFFNHAISTHEMATKLLEFVRKIQLPLIEVSNKSGAMPIYFAKKIRPPCPYLICHVY